MHRAEQDHTPATIPCLAHFKRTIEMQVKAMNDHQIVSRNHCFEAKTVTSFAT